MAKKKETKKVEVAPEVKATNDMVEVVIENPKPKKVEPKKPSWEIKDRVYYLKQNRSSLSYSMKSSGIYYFDEEKGYERELKYCENQRTVFVDEMQGDQRLAHIMFRNGALYVPREKVTLQKLLSLYHPMRDKLFYEHKPQEIAATELDYLEFEADALVLARTLDIDKMEAIMRVELGSKVAEMSSKELKRDLLYKIIHKKIKNIVKVVDKAEMDEYIDRNICHNNSKSNLFTNILNKVSAQSYDAASHSSLL